MALLAALLSSRPLAAPHGCTAPSSAITSLDHAAPALHIAESPGKGRGVFAAQPLRRGEWVGWYEGERLSLEQVRERYPCASASDYLFQLADDAYIDGVRSRHFSRCINHHEKGNLEVVREEERLAFYASAAIAEGEELTFDYGLDFWVEHSADPVTGSDSRGLTIKARRWAKRARRVGITLVQTGAFVGWLLPVAIPVCANLCS
ncbi:hypothetical protein AB1Y20_018244 [Prymnesium parvum]|uniref:SET domain-containing protein n=1 Tax=Prymnesium parvum TaxID=97485 RepID=A0AB34JN22_PRYPA